MKLFKTSVLILSGFLFFSVGVKAQTTPRDKTKQIYLTADIPPSFPGGTAELNKYLHDEIKYPAAEKKKKIEGKVVMQMVIEKDGTISNVRIMKGLTPDLNKEALRVVTKMPEWEPGKMEGIPVRVLQAISVNFEL
jgi:protein TonB